MSLAILNSRAQLGIDAPPVNVEVFLSGGLPSFSIVGMAETAVRESKDRVRGAIITSGFPWPQQRITVSLAPADMPKAGGRFDLAIAVGILVASRNIPAADLESLEFYGELALNGELRPIPGVLTAALQARRAGRAVFVPPDNGREAAMTGVPVLAPSSLGAVAGHLAGTREIERLPVVAIPPARRDCPDLADVRGQQQARRALEIAAAGGHNLLFIGPPGTGKSMLARRLPGILPPMTEDEVLETAAIESVLGRAPDVRSWRMRPFRAPHHTASATAIVGGGRTARPGEISRAHNGVLFLDELPEFNRNVLEALREPLESGSISITRANRSAEYLADFQLLAAMNPCPCGYLGDPQEACRCSADRVEAYRGKVSGPLLDRIDLHVGLGRPSPEALRSGAPAGEPSAAVAKRVAGARARQISRAGRCNARLNLAGVNKSCVLDDRSQAMLDAATDRFRLSARTYQRVRRVARTIADLSGAADIALPHLAEALSMRLLEKK